jgi:hypothetical protein
MGSPFFFRPQRGKPVPTPSLKDYGSSTSASTPRGSRRITHTAARGSSLLLTFITTFPPPLFPPRPLYVGQPVIGMRRRCDLARIIRLEGCYYAPMPSWIDR